MQRFWFLENVARMPYFSYTTMLTLYESLGWWRCGMDNRRIRARLSGLFPASPFDKNKYR